MQVLRSLARHKKFIFTGVLDNVKVATYWLARVSLLGSIAEDDPRAKQAFQRVMDWLPGGCACLCWWASGRALPSWSLAASLCLPANVCACLQRGRRLGAPLHA